MSEKRKKFWIRVIVILMLVGLVLPSLLVILGRM